MAGLVIRKHRLTEMFLVETMGFGWEQVHDIAEQIEHIDSEEFFNRMDELLGSPSIDPHGSPIPKKLGIPDFPLLNLPILQNAKIAQQQVNEHITAQLWKLGLLPNTTFTIKKIEENFEKECFHQRNRPRHLRFGSDTCGALCPPVAGRYKEVPCCHRHRVQFAAFGSDRPAKSVWSGRDRRRTWPQSARWFCLSDRACARSHKLTGRAKADWRH